MSDELEAILINKCKKNDIDAFERLVLKYEKTVFNIAFRMLSDYESARDVSQEVFIKVYKNIKNYEASSSFSTWLYRITYNTCIDVIRKSKNKETLSLDQHYSDEFKEIQIKGSSPSPEEDYLQKEFIEELQNALNFLSDEHRMVIILREIKCLSYAEIADVLNSSIGTVKSRISRARTALKKILENTRELNNKHNV